VLRRLRLAWPKWELCDDEVRFLATTVAAATQLITLEVSAWLCEVNDFGILLARSVEACTALRDLRLEICLHANHPPDLMFGRAFSASWLSSAACRPWGL
jgi:hypothetical protein